MTSEPRQLSLPELRSRVVAAVAPRLRRAEQLGFLGGVSIEDQIDHALGFVFCAESLLGRAPRTALDLGSGGGLPGLILASCWPDSHFLFVDSNSRRTTFLTSAAGDLFPGAAIQIVRSRAEEIGRDDALRSSFELVTARSFGSPAVTSECGAPFLSVGGLMVVSEPPGELESPRWPAEGLVELGMSVREKLRFDDRFSFQVLAKVAPTPDRYPRRVGIPAKRPLF